ncbi:MAG TPA: hypothetical protein VFJ07_09550 [Streptosporangiaceae bacterium]|nr:hypothetical protein [Streptosporangiaceae bacterium]
MQRLRLEHADPRGRVVVIHRPGRQVSLANKHPGGVVLTGHVLRDGGHGERFGQQFGLPGFPGHGHRRVQRRPRTRRIRLQHGKEATHEITPATAVRIAAFFGKREKGVKPSDAFSGRARDPEPAERGGEIDAAGRVAAADALLHDRADVVDLQVRPAEPRSACPCCSSRSSGAPAG